MFTTGDWIIGLSGTLLICAICFRLYLQEFADPLYVNGRERIIGGSVLLIVAVLLCTLVWMALSYMAVKGAM